MNWWRIAIVVLGVISQAPSWSGEPFPVWADRLMREVPVGTATFKAKDYAEEKGFTCEPPGKVVAAGESVPREAVRCARVEPYGTFWHRHEVTFFVEGFVVRKVQATQKMVATKDER